MLKQINDPDYSPPHPGEILREDMLPRLRLGAASLAGRLHLPETEIAAGLAERSPLTGALALRLAVVFGHPVRFWLGLQTQFDRWQAQSRDRAA